jgi:hypothetical protein
VLCAVPLLWIEYLLLRPVSQSLVLLAVLFNLISLAVEAVSKLFLLLVMPTLGSPDYLMAFEPHQLQILANIALRSHDIAFNIALIFFGLTCLLTGYLIFRSGYLPKFIGILIQLAGVCYLVACFAALFAPRLADLLTPGILLPPLIGESSFCLWLLIKGVDIDKWKVECSWSVRSVRRRTDGRGRRARCSGARSDKEDKSCVFDRRDNRSRPRTLRDTSVQSPR